MHRFIVKHPMNGVMNYNLKRGWYQYKTVYKLNATSLEAVFHLCQNDFNEDYASKSIRSTAVGDIIIDTQEDKHYFVAGTGFEEIPPTVASFIDWGNNQYEDAYLDEFEITSDWMRECY